MGTDSKTSDEAAKAALSSKETALRVEQEKRAQAVKAEATDKAERMDPPEDKLNPDG